MLLLLTCRRYPPPLYLFSCPQARSARRHAVPTRSLAATHPPFWGVTPLPVRVGCTRVLGPTAGGRVTRSRSAKALDKAPKHRGASGRRAGELHCACTAPASRRSSACGASPRSAAPRCATALTRPAAATLLRFHGLPHPSVTACACVEQICVCFGTEGRAQSPTAGGHIVRCPRSAKGARARHRCVTDAHVPFPGNPYGVRTPQTRDRWRRFRPRLHPCWHLSGAGAQL